MGGSCSYIAMNRNYSNFDGQWLLVKLNRSLLVHTSSTKQKLTKDATGIIQHQFQHTTESSYKISQCRLISHFTKFNHLCYGREMRRKEILVLIKYFKFGPTLYKRTKEKIK